MLRQPAKMNIMNNVDRLEKYMPIPIPQSLVMKQIYERIDISFIDDDQ